ncbi:uncharacterized protein LOC129313918 [Prosopis cineraria]|uniref:uncharacterized protein LOC129313918 n=1 Tax=Prosopis cineraria TaxID=364024 RepID=UPI0024102239|nr:uncharacterized protein LOC129313918 [Prosopis cineraria]
MIACDKRSMQRTKMYGESGYLGSTPLIGEKLLVGQPFQMTCMELELHSLPLTVLVVVLPPSIEPYFLPFQSLRPTRSFIVLVAVSSFRSLQYLFLVLTVQSLFQIAFRPCSVIGATIVVSISVIAVVPFRCLFRALVVALVSRRTTRASKGEEKEELQLMCHTSRCVDRLPRSIAISKRGRTSLCHVPWRIVRPPRHMAIFWILSYAK